MKLTLSWLRIFLDIDDVFLEDIEHKLIHLGFEVQSIIRKECLLQYFEVAELIKIDTHPNDDSLKVCKLLLYSNRYHIQVVSSLYGLEVGMKVVVACPGSTIINSSILIKKLQIKGFESHGIICSNDDFNNYSILNGKNHVFCLPQNVNTKVDFANYICIEDVIDINISFQQSYAFGVYGLALDLAASGLGKLKTLNFLENKNGGLFKCKYNIFNDLNIASVVVKREIKNCDNSFCTPKYIRSLLLNIGFKTSSFVLDIAFYVSYLFGCVINVYDADKITEYLSLTRSTISRSFTSTSGITYKLAVGDVILSDAFAIHSIGGLCNSIDSFCTFNTKNIFVCSFLLNQSFINELIHYSVKSNNYRYLFNMSINNAFISKVINIYTEILYSLINISFSYIKHIDSLRVNNTDSINFSLSLFRSKTNMIIPEFKITKILETLGFSFLLQNVNYFKVFIPNHRLDISIAEDLFYEVSRVYGYYNIIEEHLPCTKINITNTILDNNWQTMFNLKKLLAIHGYHEVLTWSFMSDVKARYFTDIHSQLILENPINDDLNYMRPSLIPNLLDNVYKNFNRSVFNFSIFELGPIFDIEHGIDMCFDTISGIRLGYNIDSNVHETPRFLDVFDIKTDISNVLYYFGLDFDRCHIYSDIPKYFYFKNAGSIKLNSRSFCCFGQLSPTILKKFDIDMAVFAFEINLSVLLSIKSKLPLIKKRFLSDYQVVSRNYAFIVNQTQSVGVVINFIRDIDIKIKSVSLFDIYNGSNVPKNCKSIAVSVSIQDNYRTLTSSDIAFINTKIIDGVKANFGGVLLKDFLHKKSTID